MEPIVALALLLTSLAGIVTSAILLWKKVVHPFFRFCKRLGTVADVVNDLPEWCASVDSTLRELHPNGGGSMKDRITIMSDLLERHIKDPSLHNLDGRSK